jgi:hypothetical protein
MSRRTKILIIIGILILLMVAGFWASRFFIPEKKVSWKTSTGGEFGIAIPNIPGMSLISEEKKECSYRAEYLYTLKKDVDISDYLKKTLQDNIQKRSDWQLKKR